MRSNSIWKTAKAKEPMPRVRKMFRFAAAGILSVIFIFLISAPASAQQPDVPLPKKIRGYKVYDEILKYEFPADGEAESEEFTAVVEKPVLKDISLSGLEFELDAEITSLERSATIETISFHDFRVNDIPVTVRELNKSFALKKGIAVRLPNPVTVKLSALGMVRGAWNELRDSKEKWTITGRIFVFGKFKKFGFNFKRVVPVDVVITIDNPVRSEQGSYICRRATQRAYLLNGFALNLNITQRL